MAVWFNKQSRLVQILLLLIPGVNWVVEILIRWSAFLHTKSLVTLQSIVKGISEKHNKKYKII